MVSTAVSSGVRCLRDPNQNRSFARRPLWPVREVDRAGPGGIGYRLQQRSTAGDFAMTDQFSRIMTVTGLSLDGAGVVIVVIGAFMSVLHFLLRRGMAFADSYRLLREDVGRAILLALEFLIAGDIIRSVVVDPTVINIVTLGMIVLIRTFLSMTLQLEVEGRWPWQPRRDLSPSTGT
jgi:uncharacterized membrane protein